MNVPGANAPEGEKAETMTPGLFIAEVSHPSMVRRPGPATPPWISCPKGTGSGGE